MEKFNLKNGFSLVELMVSIAVFGIVMVAIMGSIVTIVDANRKSEQLRVVMDNLNLTLDSMTRLIRFGSNYHCGAGGNTAEPANCPTGESSFTFMDTDGKLIMYEVVNNQIVKTVNGSTYTITSSDMVIDKLQFFVNGALLEAGSTPDDAQPQVRIVVSGYTGKLQSKRSFFSLQTTVSQRKFDY